MMNAVSRDVRRRTHILLAFIRQAVRESKLGFMPGCQIHHLPFDAETFVLDPVVPRLRDLLCRQELKRYQSFAPSLRPEIVAGELTSLINVYSGETIDPTSYRRNALTSIKGIMDSFEAMQRIRDTPIARPYTWIMMITLCVVVFSPPLIYKDNAAEFSREGLMVLLLTELLALSFFGIALIGQELEDPYGYRIPDVPLEQV